TKPQSVGAGATEPESSPPGRSSVGPQPIGQTSTRRPAASQADQRFMRPTITIPPRLGCSMLPAMAEAERAPVDGRHPAVPASSAAALAASGAPPATPRSAAHARLPLRTLLAYAAPMAPVNFSL